MIAGVVLAGGGSTRFGSEKAVARLGPAPLVEHAAQVLLNGCGAVAINAPEASRAARWARDRGLPVAPDREGPAQGPVAGVLAAMDWAAGQGAALVATAPCDCPVLPRDLVARLVAGLPPDAGAVGAATPLGPEPACAVWRVSARPVVEAALADGASPSLRAVLAGVGAAEVAFADAAAFADADTTAALERLRSLRALPRRAGAALLRLAATLLLCAYALGGLIIVAVMAAAADPASRAPAGGGHPPASPGEAAVLAAGGLWFVLVVWAAPRLLAAPASAAPLPSPPQPPLLTKQPSGRI